MKQVQAHDRKQHTEAKDRVSKEQVVKRLIEQREFMFIPDYYVFSGRMYRNSGDGTLNIRVESDRMYDFALKSLDRPDYINFKDPVRKKDKTLIEINALRHDVFADGQRISEWTYEFEIKDNGSTTIRVVSSRSGSIVATMSGYIKPNPRTI